MIKKILSLLLIITVTFSMVACHSSKKENANGSNLQVEQKILTVDITLPPSLVTPTIKNDIEGYAKKQGFQKAVLNDNGSVTITMTKAKHKQMMKEMKQNVEEKFAKLQEDYPYIKTIDYKSKNFSNVNVIVDRHGYDNSFDITPFSIGFQAMYYQAFNGTDLKCEVIMKYADNDEIISTTIYPDALKSN
jgi:hypothetical protein